MTDTSSVGVILTCLVIVATLLSGVLAFFVTNRIRNRIPQIGFRQSISSVNPPVKLVEAQIIFILDKKEFHYKNLYIIETQIQNKSERDFKEFDIKLELSSVASVIHVESKSLDKSHEVLLKSKINFENPASEVDFSLNPFNRKDLYHITFYVKCDEKRELTKNNVTYSSKIRTEFISLG